MQIIDGSWTTSQSEELFSLLCGPEIICWDRDNRYSEKQDHFCYHFTTAEFNLLNTCVAVVHEVHTIFVCEVLKNWLVIGFLFISSSCIGFDVVHLVVFRVQ